MCRCQSLGHQSLYTSEPPNDKVQGQYLLIHQKKVSIYFIHQKKKKGQYFLPIKIKISLRQILPNVLDNTVYLEFLYLIPIFLFIYLFDCTCLTG